MRRGPEMALAGLWEFPGGKVKANETPELALEREIREELGLDITVGQSLGSSMALAAGSAIDLEVFSASIETGEIELREHDDLRWCTRADLAELTWAPADIPLLAAVAALIDYQASRAPEH